MELETLRGEVIRWRMPPKTDTAWHIVEVLDDAGATHVVTGCGLPRPGAQVELAGAWETHARFGPQFHARTIVKARAPLNAEGVMRWLRERCNGIGTKRAAGLLASFGGDASKLWAAVELGSLDGTGLSPELQRSICEAYAEEGAVAEYQALLHGWGMTQRQIAKVKKHWPLEKAQTLLHANPYLLADHVEGFGFNRADEVARRLGIPHHDPVRVNAALLHFLEQHAGQGHVFVDEPLVKAIARDTRTAYERLIEGVQALRATGRLIVEDGSRVYLPGLRHAECVVAHDLYMRFGAAGGGPRRLAGPSETEMPTIVDVRDARASDPWQTLAIELATDASQPIVFITGGPGTGKTTVLREALDRLRAQGVTTSLAAPTGKAAKRMTEATGQRASTLHALLGYRPALGVECETCKAASSEFDFSRIASESPRVVIVDEASMVDVGMWAALAGAVSSDVRLVFVGDPNQLPPVGPGQPFADALAVAPRPAVVKLRTVFRSKGEWVKAAAPAVLRGEVPTLADAPGLRWLEVDRADEVVPTVLRMVQGELDSASFSASEAQTLGHMPILTPQRTGAAGVNAINIALQALLNPAEPDAPSFDLEDGTTLREGAWVMATKNDPRKHVCNGDTGYVTLVDENSLWLQLDGSDEAVQYKRTEAREQLRLAYASTVHKSQGSEYPWVAVVCHSAHKRMLTRRLLYTAITRAKEGVVLIGDREGVEWAVKNTREVVRCSWLQQRVMNAPAGDA